MGFTNNRYGSDQIKLAMRKLGIKFPHNIDSKNRSMAHCPFHEDKTPSMSIDFDKAIYHCFSCDASGSVNNLSERLCGRNLDTLLGIDSSFSLFTNKPKFEYKPKPVNEEDINLDIRGVIEPWVQSISAENYLKARFIPDRIANEMKIGFIAEAYINKTRYVDRLVIPIYGVSGKLINLEGRDVTGTSTHKCLYPQGITKTIYEWYKLDKNKPLYVVEGLTKMACLRGDDYFKNSTTIFGAAVTDHQIDLLNTFKKIVLIPDNDEPGKKVIENLRNRLKTKLEIMRISDMEVKDIDEIPRKLGCSVEDYRKKGRFLVQSFTSFLFGDYV